MTDVMTEYDQKWNIQYEKLVEFKQKNGHCLVPQKYKEDKGFGRWVAGQRVKNKNNKMGPFRKELLDELGFVWEVDVAVRLADSIAARVSGDDKKWSQHYETLVEFQQTNGHCFVPWKDKQDNKSLIRVWVGKQRQLHNQNKIRLDRKELLDAIGFFDCKSDTITARSSTTDDVRGLVICIISPFGRVLFLTLLPFMLHLCRIRIRKQSTSVEGVFQS
jgi:hypothetical protein